MEKIYMENNSKNNGRKSSTFFRNKGILATSLFIALIAIALFITSGFNGESFAIPDVANPLPDSFTTAQPGNELIGIAGATTTSAIVFPYFTSGGVQVFCLEKNIDFAAETNYSKGESINDYGLLYLMANSYPNKEFKNSNGASLDKALQTWITQMAIWDYLYVSGDEDNNQFANIVEEVKKVTKIREEVEDNPMGVEYDALGVNLFDTYINPLVQEAIKNKNVPNKVLDIKLDNKNISITGDEKYYQSSAITVVGSPSDNFNGFNVKLFAAPEGSILIDEKGEEISDTKDLSSGSKIYIRVPVNKVNEENKVVKVSVTGSFTTYEGNYYVSPGNQTITSVNTVNNNLNKGISIELNYTPDVPDTGMSTSQTIYFIGLVVLISGLGIIYANVKPKENN